MRLEFVTKLLVVLRFLPTGGAPSYEERFSSARQNYDSIAILVTGEPYPSLWWEERTACLAKISPTLEASLDAAWAGMNQYWDTRGGENDTWYECDTTNLPIIEPMRSPDAYFENNCTRQEPITMDIWEPCNYASNLAYDRLMFEMCLQEDWAFSPQTVANISQAFALITYGSAFMHGSNTELGQKQDTVSNDLFPFIIYQAGVSNIPYNPVIHDLAVQPRSLNAEEIVAVLFDMYETKPVTSWMSICETISMPSLQRTFTGIFGYIMTLVLDPSIVDQLVPIFLDLLAVSDEDREFTTVHFFPAIREASSQHYLGLRDRLVLLQDTLATVVKLFYAFVWQEKVIDFNGSNLTPEANQLGAQFLPIINQYANNQTSWSLHVEDVQNGESYPGWHTCNPTIPHAKWHAQIAASLTDVSLLMDSVLRMVNKERIK